MVSRTPIDCLKTSALRADRFTLFLSIWVATSEGLSCENAFFQRTLQETTS